MYEIKYEGVPLDELFARVAARDDERQLYERRAATYELNKRNYFWNTRRPAL